MAVLSIEIRQKNSEEQQNEKDMLNSIYEDLLEISDEADTVLTFTIKSKYFLLILRCLFHEYYPSHEPPIFSVIEVSNDFHYNININKLESHCKECFIPGETVVYQWVDYLQSYLDTLDNFIEENKVQEIETTNPSSWSKIEVPDVEDKHISEICLEIDSLEIDEAFTIEELESKFDYDKCQPIHNDESDSKISIFTGEILTDRKSHFQAHICKVNSKDEIKNALSTLLQNSKVAAATHNIVAYRYVSSSGVLVQDYDDDGETKAGGRLLEMLDLMKVENLLVVVTRWYGGVHLGPVRFKHINNIAHETILASGFYNPDVSKKGKSKKSCKK